MSAGGVSLSTAWSSPPCCKMESHFLKMTSHKPLLYIIEHPLEDWLFVGLSVCAHVCSSQLKARIPWHTRTFQIHHKICHTPQTAALPLCLIETKTLVGFFTSYSSKPAATLTSDPSTYLTFTRANYQDPFCIWAFIIFDQAAGFWVEPETIGRFHGSNAQKHYNDYYMY